MAGHFANQTAVVTPNGKMLSHDLDDGLKRWKALPQAERTQLEEIGAYDAAKHPEPPPGGLVVKVFYRAFVREAGGKLEYYKKGSTRNLEPGRDHLWLTEAEWRSLIPPPTTKAERRAMPDLIAERICRRYLIDLVRVGGFGGPRRPQDVLARELWLTTEKKEGTSVRLRVDGTARVSSADASLGGRGGKDPKIDDYRFEGHLEYDTVKKTMTRFDLVAFSETGHYDEVNKKVTPFGIAFELSRAETPSERVAPTAYGKDYFGAEKKR